MTATLTTPDEAFGRKQTADFRLSARQRDVLRTLNTLFDELSPPALKEEDFIEILESRLEAFDVSQTIRL